MKREVGRPAKNNFENIDLATVHDALSESRFEGKPRVTLESMTIRVDPTFKELAQKICATNNTTISDFLRCCVKALVRDYAGQQTFDKIQSDVG